MPFKKLLVRLVPALVAAIVIATPTAARAETRTVPLNPVDLFTYAADEICLDLNSSMEDGDLERIFQQAINAHLNLSCEGISSAKELADIKRYGCLVGRGSHLYPEMTRFEFEKMMQYPSSV